jgi:hypothetical protein
MDEQSRKNGLMDQIAKLNDSHGVETSPNFKFMLMMRSRLLEEHIPLEATNTILSVLEYDFSNLNEEDDFLGDVASEFAPVLKKIYDVFESHGFEDLTPVKEHFNLLKLCLPELVVGFEVTDEDLEDLRLVEGEVVEE